MLKSPALLLAFFLAALPPASGGNIPDRPLAPPRPVAPKPTRYGLLWLEIEPEDADVSLDGRFLDVKVWLVSVAPGPHVVTIRKQGFRPQERSFGIGGGESLTLDIRLEQDSASVPP